MFIHFTRLSSHMQILSICWFKKNKLLCQSKIKIPIVYHFYYYYFINGASIKKAFINRYVRKNIINIFVFSKNLKKIQININKNQKI